MSIRRFYFFVEPTDDHNDHGNGRGIVERVQLVHKMLEADIQYRDLVRVSRELLQSSYALTRKAREYVNTGDEASERAYYDILAQHPEKRPGRPPCGREVISLPDLMERYGASRRIWSFW